MFTYLINWIAFIVQHPGTKTETAFVLKGLPGIGKNTFFTDVLCELLNGYSEKNITDIKDITGDRNAVLENKMLIVLNEVKNVKDVNSRMFQVLKSIITDTHHRVGQMYKEKKSVEQCANFIFVSNNSFPVQIEEGDRRYFVSYGSAKYKGNFDFFKKQRQF